jgi:hypothetical protein
MTADEIAREMVSTFTRETGLNPVYAYGVDGEVIQLAAEGCVMWWNFPVVDLEPVGWCS